MLARCFAAAMVAAAVGCSTGPTGSPSDPSAAKDALTAALTAWKTGTTIEAYRGANPAVTIIEPKWLPNVKLLDFEPLSDGKSSGYDVVFTTKLTVQGADNKKQTDKAIYTVSTQPKLVVLRTEPGG